MSDQPADSRPKRPGASVEAAPPPAASDLLKPDQAAAWLGVSESTLKRIVHAGSIPTHTVGKRRRFRLADLAAYVEGTRAFSTPVPALEPAAAAARKARPPRFVPSSLTKPGDKIVNPYLEKLLRSGG